MSPQSRPVSPRVTEPQHIHHLKKEVKTMAEVEARDIKFFKGPKCGDWNQYIYALYVDGKLKNAGDYHVIEDTLTVLGYEPDKDGYHHPSVSRDDLDDFLTSHGVEIVESGDFVLGGVEDGYNMSYAAPTLAHVEIFREIREHVEAEGTHYREGLDRTEDQIEQWPGDEEWPADE